jgi:hypothetical protein
MAGIPTAPRRSSNELRARGRDAGVPKPLGIKELGET